MNIRLPSLAALRAFDAAARHGSLSQAARELNVTHAAIAHHVKGLEAEFAQSLLEREGRGVRATAAGAQLAQSLRQGFAQIEDGVETLRVQGLDRPLAISVTHAFAEQWLMPRIGDFWAKHPDTQLNITPSRELVDLRRDGFDLALRFGDGSWPGVAAEILTDGDFWVVARPDLVRGRTLNCLPDVVDLPWVLENHMLSNRGIIEREGIDFEQLNMTLLNTSGMVMSAVTAGLGLTVQSQSLVRARVERGDLTKICELSQPGIGYYMVTLPGQERPGLRTFKSWLKASAKHLGSVDAKNP